MKKNSKGPFKTRTIFEFPYFGKKVGFFRIFLIKSLLASLFSGAGAVLTARMLGAEVDYTSLGLLSGILCFDFLLLFSFFRQGVVVLFTVLSAGIMAFFWHDFLLECGKVLWNCMMTMANGRLINTSSVLMPSANYDLLFSTMLIIGATIAFFTALASVGRFRADCLLLIVFFSIPSFLGENARFYPEMTAVAAAFMGLWSISSTAFAFERGKFGGVGGLIVKDREHNKQTRHLVFLKKMREDARHYGKFTSNGVTAFISVLLTVSIIAGTVPPDIDLTATELIASIGEFASDVGSSIASFFRGGIDGRGFFSADNRVDISGKISTQAPTASNTPVLEVTLQTQDKVYLRGDIGYNYSDENWNSISGINYSEYQYSAEQLPSIDGTNNEIYAVTNMQDVLDSGYPDASYLIAYNRGGKDIFIVEDIRISYLQHMSTVLLPTLPLNQDIRSSDAYTVHGDFIARTNGIRINNFSTVGIIPKEIVDDEDFSCLEALVAVNEEIKESSYSDIPQYENYKEYMNIYNAFIKDVYLDVPEAEQANIDKLLEEMKNYYERNFGIYAISSVSRVSTQMTAYKMSEYFKSSGFFTYSLTADNHSGDNSYLGNFLEGKRGHCALYATALCLSLRSFGIPARYVTGFTVGGAQSPTKIDETGLHYTLQEKNLHAWVEYYIEGVGWLPLDPTPPDYLSIIGEETEITSTSIETTTFEAETTTHRDIDEMTTTSAISVDSESAETELSSSPSGSSGGDNGEFLRGLLITAGFVLGAAAIASLVTGGLRALNRRQRRRLSHWQKSAALPCVRGMYKFILRLLHVNGISQTQSETPLDFAERADEQLPLEGKLLELMPLLERAEFDSNPAISEEERMAVYDYLSELLRRTLSDRSAFSRLILRIRLFS